MGGGGGGRFAAFPARVFGKPRRDARDKRIMSGRERWYPKDDRGAEKEIPVFSLEMYVSLEGPSFSSLFITTKPAAGEVTSCRLELHHPHLCPPPRFSPRAGGRPFDYQAASNPSTGRDYTVLGSRVPLSHARVLPGSSGGDGGGNGLAALQIRPRVMRVPNPRFSD